jgi:site-specific recombinase XerC
MTFSWVLDERKFLPSEQVSKLRKFCNQRKETARRTDKFIAVRNWFMIELGLNTGLRVQEMTDLQWGDMFVSALEASVVVRKGKGKRKRSVWIGNAFKKECQFFKYWVNLQGHSVNDEAFVFTSKTDSPLTKRSLQKAFKQIVINAGLPDYYSIHCLRHTYATHLLKASGNNYKLVSSQLGHSSIKVTEVYTNLIRSDVKKALSKLYE